MFGSDRTSAAIWEKSSWPKSTRKPTRKRATAPITVAVAPPRGIRVDRRRTAGSIASEANHAMSRVKRKELPPLITKSASHTTRPTPTSTKPIRQTFPGSSWMRTVGRVSSVVEPFMAALRSSAPDPPAGEWVRSNPPPGE